MTDTGSPEFPTAKDDDDDDVAWGLSTAQVQWKRGSQADAVVWLRRAIDAAVAVGATWRAAELTRQTDTLEAYLVSGPPAAPRSAPSNVAIEDFDGTDIIDDEAMSPPPDTEVDDLAPTPLHADATDERTDVTPEDDSPSVEPPVGDEVQAEEIVELDDDEISEDDLADDDLSNRELPRFESEAPTADLSAPDFAAEEDPLPTPPRLSVADAIPLAYQNQPEPLPYEIEPPPPAPPPPPPPLPPPPFRSRQPAPEPEQAAVAVAETETAIEAETATETETVPGFAFSRPLPPALSPSPEPPPALAAEPEPEPEPLGEPIIVGISLAEIRGFEDFPPEIQVALAKAARVERLATEEEVTGFGLALVLRGAVNVMPAIADIACGAAGERELVYGRGTLPDGVALRLVATAPDTQVAIWDFDVIGPPLQECPWVLQELQEVADRYQALAGVSMGPMGERLDDSLRGMVLSRCRLVKLLPGEILVEKGKPVGGLFIVGAGRIDLGTDPDRPASEGRLVPGDFLFAPQVLSAGGAPTAARAGAAGALLMAADRHAAHELMLSVPPLLELLAG